MLLEYARRLVRWLGRVTTADDESESPWNGPLSTKAEWHAMGIGGGLGVLTGAAILVAGPTTAGPVVALAVVVIAAAIGVRSSTDLAIPDRYIHQIRKEVPYYLGAYAAGVLPFVLW